MTDTDTATQPTEQPVEVARVERPLHPTSPRELLLTTYHASSLHGAEQILATFQEYDFELARKQPLDAEQRGRAEALRVARSVVEGRTPISTNALTPVQTSELVPLARFILTGSEFEPDVRIEVAQERAAREAAEQAQDPEDGCPGGC